MEKIEIKLKECCLTCKHFDQSGIKGLTDPVYRVIACGHVNVCKIYLESEEAECGKDGLQRKELIERLREYSQLWVAYTKLSATLGDAADAIEALLEEREKAIDDSRVECSVCKNYNIWERFATGKCASCQTMRLCMMSIGNGFDQSISDRQQTES